MLLGKTRIGHGEAHREEVDGGPPTRVVDDGLPTRLVAVRMVDDKETTVGGIESGTVASAVGNDRIAMLQTPYYLGETPMRSTLGTREKHLGVKSVEEGRVQVELRLGTKKMLQPIHGAKIQNKV